MTRTFEHKNVKITIKLSSSKGTVIYGRYSIKNIKVTQLCVFLSKTWSGETQQPGHTD